MECLLVGLVVDLGVGAPRFTNSMPLRALALLSYSRCSGCVGWDAVDGHKEDLQEGGLMRVVMQDPCVWSNLVLASAADPMAKP